MGENVCSRKSMFKKALEHRVGRPWRGRMRKRFSSDILRRRMVYLQMFTYKRRMVMLEKGGYYKMLKCDIYI